MSKIINGLQRADFQINRALATVSCVVALLAMLLVTADVSGRFLFKSPIAGTLEITEIAMVLIVFCSITYFQITRGHLAMTLLYSRLSAKGQGWCDLLAKALTLSIFPLMTWQAFIFTRNAWTGKEVTWGMVHFPLWIPKFAILLGCFLFSLHFLGSFLLQVVNMVRSRGNQC